MRLTLCLLACKVCLATELVSQVRSIHSRRCPVVQSAVWRGCKNPSHYMGHSKIMTNLRTALLSCSKIARGKHMTVCFRRPPISAQWAWQRGLTRSRSQVRIHVNRYVIYHPTPRPETFFSQFEIQIIAMGNSNVIPHIIYTHSTRSLLWSSGQTATLLRGQ